MSVIIPTTLVCVLFGPTIPIINLVAFYTCTIIILVIIVLYGVLGARPFDDLNRDCRSKYCVLA